MASILIISANSDIAKACAQEFASSGYDLFLCSRQIEKTREFAGELEKKFPIKTLCYPLDINDTSRHKACLTEIFTQGELDAPNGLIVCTGLLGEQTIAEQNFEHAQNIIHTNFSNITNVLERFVVMLESANTTEAPRPERFIAVLSSVAGDRGRRSNYIYASAKAGLDCYLSGLRNRLQTQGIQVITVKPGYVKTRMTERMTLPPLLTCEAETVAKALSKAQQHNKDVVYVSAIWKWIMLVIKLLPERVFKAIPWN